ncbi:MAG: hypothetical protein AABW73_04475 [Nanoarchaeota archaeon]
MFDNIKKIVGIKQKKGVRSPTLDTVIMVDEFIKEKSGKYKKTEIFKNLPRKVMWQTFQVIINYLEENKKIRTNSEGLVEHIWISEKNNTNTENI